MVCRILRAEDYTLTEIEIQWQLLIVRKGRELGNKALEIVQLGNVIHHILPKVLVETFDMFRNHLLIRQ